ncbi:hypothetical protein [Picosynechococcus sp. NKBG15041c]|uniref:hypothetical protein n=1 Tax=Picosynechococcus sp. NKBG15041c TaxID=1407650 RepID=UPI000411D96D|nr:hypothetical protein [Picosynechococcus sp. NKBG15041c]
MRVWLTSVVVLFIVVQVFQLLKGFFVPLPLYILGGAFLAIASNYDKGIMTVFKTKELPNDQNNSES